MTWLKKEAGKADKTHVIIDDVPYCISLNSTNIKYEGKEPLDKKKLLESEKHRASVVACAAYIHAEYAEDKESYERPETWSISCGGKNLKVMYDGSLSTMEKKANADGKISTDDLHGILASKKEDMSLAESVRTALSTAYTELENSMKEMISDPNLDAVNMATSGSALRALNTLVKFAMDDMKEVTDHLDDDAKKNKKEGEDDKELSDKLKGKDKKKDDDDDDDSPFKEDGEMEKTPEKKDEADEEKKSDDKDDAKDKYKDPKDAIKALKDFVSEMAKDDPMLEGLLAALDTIEEKLTGSVDDDHKDMGDGDSCDLGLDDMKLDLKPMNDMDSGVNLGKIEKDGPVNHSDASGGEAAIILASKDAKKKLKLKKSKEKAEKMKGKKGDPFIGSGLADKQTHPSSPTTHSVSGSLEREADGYAEIQQRTKRCKSNDCDEYATVNGSCEKCDEPKPNQSVSEDDKLIPMKGGKEEKASLAGFKVHDRVWLAVMQKEAHSLGDEPGRVVAMGNGKIIVDWGDIDAIPTEEDPKNLVKAASTEDEASLFGTVTEEALVEGMDALKEENEEDVKAEVEKVLQSTSLKDMLSKNTRKSESSNEHEITHVASGKKGEFLGDTSAGQVRVNIEGKDMTLWPSEVKFSSEDSSGLFR